MKKKVMHRILSGVLALVMLISFVPVSALIAFAVDNVAQGSNVTDYGEFPERKLGLGYNAIAGKSIEDSLLQSLSWIDYDSADLRKEGTKHGATGVLDQGGEAKFHESSLDFMSSLGVDFSNTTNANFTMGAIKAGVENKFSSNFNLSTTVTKNEMYFYYVYKAILNKYAMGTNYGQYLNQDFIAAVDALGYNPTNMQLEAFFKTWGTHMLTSFSTGGEFELTSWFTTEGELTTESMEVKNELSANVGNDAVGVKNTLEMGMKLDTSTNQKNTQSGSIYKARGGNAAYIGAVGIDKIDVNSFEDENIKLWVASLNEEDNGNGAFLPSTTEWIAIWEVLSYDVKYNALCERMYNYFMEAVKDQNNDFIKKYCSFSSRLELGGYTYISPIKGKTDRYVYQNVPFVTISNSGQSDNLVAKGSKVIVSKTVTDSLYSIDEISYEIVLESDSSGVDVDRNGVISIATNAQGSFALHMKYDGVTISIVKFTIAEDSNSGGYGYSGGYGTSERPYLISSKEDLDYLAKDTLGQYKHFILINDIDFNGNTFNGISSFSGVFDGNGHRICGFRLETANTGDQKHVGLFWNNTGTIRNLIIGKADYNYNKLGEENKSNLTGTNIATGVTGPYSVVIRATQNENNVDGRYSVGALVGWNQGVIDNCRVENTYVYGCLTQKKGNTDGSYIYVGMVGTNAYFKEENAEQHNNTTGVITRCVSTGNYFEAYATALKDSADKNHTYVGGIAGRSSGKISHCVSSHNTLRSDARGDGIDNFWSDDEKATAEAIAGGLVGRVSNVYENDSKKAFKQWQVSNSYAYNNYFSIYYTDTSLTNGYYDVGGLVGQAISSITEDTPNTFSSLYTDNDKSKYVVRGTDKGVPKPIGELNDVPDRNIDDSKTAEELVNAGGSGYVIKEDNDLVIPMPNTLIVSGGQLEYVHGDSINPEGIRVQIQYQNGKIFQQYNNGAYKEILTLNHFKIAGTSTASNSAIGDKTINDIVITSFGGTTHTEFQPTVSRVVVKELNIVKLPSSTEYFCGDELSTDGLVIEAKYNNGDIKKLTIGECTTGEYTTGKCTIGEYDLNVNGEQEITITYSETYKYGDETTDDEVSTTFTINVYRVKPSYLTLLTSPNKTNYAIGEEFDSTGVTFTLGYNNGKRTETLNAEDVVFSGFSSKEEGNIDVVATYTYYDEDISANATLSEVLHLNIGTVESIEINTLPTKLSYYTSDKKLITDGLSINVYYSNGTVKTVNNAKAMQLSNYDLLVEGIHNVKVDYQGFTDTFEIEVLPVTLSSIEIKTLPKTKYYVPDTFTASGMVLTLNYADGTSKDVYEGFITTVEGYDEGNLPQFMTTGNKKVTVAYEEDGIRRYTSYDITISRRAITEIQVVYTPLKQIYKQNEALNTEGLVIYGVYNNGETFEIKDYTILSVNMSTVGTKTVNVIYMGSYRTSFEITVVAPERIYIEKLPNKTNYTIGETFDPMGMVVKAVYWDYSEVVLDDNTYSISEPALDDYGSEKVTVTYGSLSTSFYVQTNEFEVPEDAPKIIIDSTNATIGKTVVVNICLVNNPGIASMKLNVDYDETVLTLVDVAYNSEMGGQSQLPQDMTAPLILNWYNGWDDYIGDCVFATLTFAVSENATPNSISSVSVTYDPEDVYNILEENVTYYAEGGVLNVIEYVPGDINDDGEVNNKDVTRLFQYLSGWDVEVCEKALDVNGDGNVNNKDMTRLFQYLSGWDVEIN